MTRVALSLSLSQRLRESAETRSRRKFAGTFILCAPRTFLLPPARRARISPSRYQSRRLSLSLSGSQVVSRIFAVNCARFAHCDSPFVKGHAVETTERNEHGWFDLTFTQTERGDGDVNRNFAKTLEKEGTTRGKKNTRREIPMETYNLRVTE